MLEPEAVGGYKPWIIFWTQQERCTQQLGSCDSKHKTRRSLTQSMNRAAGRTVLVLAVELLTAVSNWERKRRCSL